MSSENQFEFKAWAASEPKGKLSEWSYTPRPIGPRDVEIDITHCGICGTDVQLIDNGFGYTTYPLVPGHEFVGTVTRVGSEVTRVKSGQRVGVGPQVQSCHECDNCNDHQENYCPKRVFTYTGVYPDGQRAFGGYAQSVRVDERFAFVIPENLKSEEVAPLLCIGITAYAPFKHNKVGPGRGSESLVSVVWVISPSSSHAHWVLKCTPFRLLQPKKKRPKKLGAHHFINTKDKDSIAKYQDQLDLIISTLNQDVDWQMYFSLVKRDGTFVIVGIPEDKLHIPAFSIIGKRLKFAGSAIGSPNEIEELLKLASKENIVANTQVWPLDKVNEAIAAFREGKPRYRFVLQIKQ